MSDEPAARAQIVRRALVTVPLVLLLGTASAALSGSASDLPWFAALRKPSFMPPAWAFPVGWTVLYALMGLALAIVLAERDVPGRRAAVVAFAVALLLNLAWSPTFFGAHQIRAALWLTGAMFAAAVVTTILFARVRRLAGLIMLPYLAWLLFAGALNWKIGELNPNAETLAQAAPSTQIGV